MRLDQIKTWRINRPASGTVLAALLLSPFTTYAAVTPDAGSILQEIRQAPQPAVSPAETGLETGQPDHAALPPGAPILVQQIKISGNTLFDTATLHMLIADAEGKSLSLSQLNQMANRISDYYRNHGYMFSRAIIPAQTIHSGEVIIAVIEGHYGKITLDNKSAVNDSLLQATLSPLQNGKMVEQTELDTRLLLLSDTPGVEVNGTMLPGETVGTSDLVVQTAAGKTVSGKIELDNYGNRYTGELRLGGTVNLINPFHHGDVLSLSGISSGNGLYNGRLSYETLLNGKGSRLGGSWSSLHYVLGNQFALLGANGIAEVTGMWAKHPLLRTRDTNIFGQLKYEQFKLRDHINSSGIMTDRHLSDWTASLNGDARDSVLSDAVTAWRLEYSTGQLGFDSNPALLADAATAKTQGRFSKWNAHFNRLQSLTAHSALYVAVSGQWASTNLDTSQKMTIGGPYTVRAYNTGAAYGDTGYFGTIELRSNFGAAMQGQLEAVAFVDSAHVTVNKRTWAAGTNDASLSGMGAGINWSGLNKWNAKAFVATKLGSTPVLVASPSSTRAWLEVGKEF